MALLQALKCLLMRTPTLPCTLSPEAYLRQYDRRGNGGREELWWRMGLDEQVLRRRSRELLHCTPKIPWWVREAAIVEQLQESKQRLRAKARESRPTKGQDVPWASMRVEA